jgi:hypothetical protein
VRGGVLEQLALVAPGPDHLAGAHDDRADRHVVVGERLPRLRQREAHAVLVVGGEGVRHARL